MLKNSIIQVDDHRSLKSLTKAEINKIWEISGLKEEDKPSEEYPKLYPGNNGVKYEVTDNRLEIENNNNYGMLITITNHAEIYRICKDTGGIYGGCPANLILKYLSSIGINLLK